MDQCQYGQCDSGGGPIRKPTKWMSNSPLILQSLSTRCTGRGGWCSGLNADKKHVPASGRVAREAAIYPFQLCKAILEGLREEMISRGRMLANLNIFAPAQLLEATRNVNPIDLWSGEASQGSNDGKEINIAVDSGANAGRCGGEGLHAHLPCRS